jgi:hypothetical protein
VRTREERNAADAANLRKRRAARKAAGVCSVHGRVPVKGHASCVDCRAKIAQNARRYLRRLVAKGVCTHHPDRAPVPDKTVCQECLDYIKSNSKRIREERKRRGICVGCGKVPVKLFVSCQSCRENTLARVNAARDKKKNRNKPATRRKAKSGLLPLPGGLTAAEQAGAGQVSDEAA